MTGRPKGTKSPLHVYTEAELTFLKWEYQDLAVPELTKAFNDRFGTSLKDSAIKGTLHRYSFKSGRDGQFRPGHVPHPNARPKGPNKTSFKKGQMPHNWNPVGHERLTKEGYLQRKIADTGCTVDDYVEVHRLLWEEHHGKIPESHVIIFRDGDKANITIENLMMVSRSDHAVMCRMGFYNGSAETKDAAVLLAKIIRKRKELESK